MGFMNWLMKGVGFENEEVYDDSIEKEKIREEKLRQQQEKRRQKEEYKARKAQEKLTEPLKNIHSDKKKMCLHAHKAQQHLMLTILSNTTLQEHIQHL